MARDLSSLFNLTAMENLQRDASLTAVTKVLAFDDLADFVEERARIQRKVQALRDAAPKVDFSKFENHVFFDSAYSKFSIAKNKILNQYPYNGSSQERDVFTLSSSLYENDVLSKWPRYVGYLNLNTNQYLTASDTQGKLYLGSSSLYVSARINLAQSATSNIISVSSGSPGNQYGYELFASPFNVTFRIYSGSFTRDFAATLTSSIQGQFCTVAAMYEAATKNVSIYVDAGLKRSVVSDIAVPGFSYASIGIGRATSYSNFSGGLDAVRVLHTASALFHLKNYNREIASEDFVKLSYHFNEGVYTDPVINSTVVDYSKSGLNATIVGYDANVRVSGSTMAVDGDPILYSVHPNVVSFVTQQEEQAKIFDAANRNYIFRLLPEEILRDDQESGQILISFSLAMARYFDDLKLYLDQFQNVRVVNYDQTDQSPDLLLPLIKKYFGWKVTDHYGDSFPLPFLFGENIAASGSLEAPLLDVKNQFWRRILNNLPYLYKTKGKRDNIFAFFNVVGINKNLVNLKEYGVVNNSTISNEEIRKEKSFRLMQFGISSQTNYVQTPLVATGVNNYYAVECVTRLPAANQAFIGGASSAGTILQYVTGSQGFLLQWEVPSIGSTSGSLLLNLGGIKYRVTNLPVFNNRLVHIVAGVSGSAPYLHARTVSQGVVTRFTSSFTGLPAPFVSGSRCLIVGSPYASQGHVGHVRYWSRVLTTPELDAHAKNPENIATVDPLQPLGLVAAYNLNEDLPVNSDGTITDIPDVSRNGRTAQGYGFNPLTSAYGSILANYSFVSPSADLKWTINKIRIRNKNQLSMSEVGNDTNQVALEFNLVDALNEDIAKILTNIDFLNNVLGAPINKYRDEYDDLEQYRRVYFDRLTTSLNFTNFFKLFRWFDQKLSSAIKQLLPARVDFVGGEFVVESHFLERNKYKYHYPIFRTPKDIGIGDVSSVVTIGDAKPMKTLEAHRPLQGTSTRTALQRSSRSQGVPVAPRETSSTVEAHVMPQLTTRFDGGADHGDRNPQNFYRRKVSGDTRYDRNTANAGVNFRNEYAKKVMNRNQAENKDGYRSGSQVLSQLGNGFYVTDMRSVTNDLHYVANQKKSIRLKATILGSYVSSTSSIQTFQSTTYDINNVPINPDQSIYFSRDSNSSGSLKYEPKFTFLVSGSSRFLPSDLRISFSDKSLNWDSLTPASGSGSGSASYVVPPTASAPETYNYKYAWQNGEKNNFFNYSYDSALFTTAPDTRTIPAGVALTASRMPASSPVANGLFASGSQLRNSLGQIVKLHGVNIPSYGYSTNGDPNQYSTPPPCFTGQTFLDVVKKAVVDWKVNFLRIPVSQDIWLNIYGTSGSYKANLSAVVAYAASQNVYVDIDLHQTEGDEDFNMPYDVSVTVISQIATYFKTSPNVIIGIHNEPRNVNYNVWRNGGTATHDDGTTYHTPGMQAMVNAVRSAGFTNAVTVSGLDYAFDLRGVANGYAISDSNLIYEAHVYPVKDTTAWWDTNITTPAGQYPILIGEFGADPNSEPSPYGAPAQFLEVLRQWISLHNYNFAAWSLDPGADPCLVSDWCYTLTPYFGQVVVPWLGSTTATPGDFGGLTAFLFNNDDNDYVNYYQGIVLDLWSDVPGNVRVQLDNGSHLQPLVSKTVALPTGSWNTVQFMFNEAGVQNSSSVSSSYKNFQVLNMSTADINGQVRLNNAGLIYNPNAVPITSSVSGSSSGSSGSLSSSRALYVKGNNFYRASDNSQWIGRGCNSCDTRFDNKAYDAPDAAMATELKRRIQWAMNQGVDFIRLCLQVNASADDVQNDAAYLAAIKNVVDFIGAQGGWCEIAVWYHYTCTPDPINQLTTSTIATWQKLATTFAKTEHVLFGLCNEPRNNSTQAARQSYLNVVNQCISAIRTAESNAGGIPHIISVSGPDNYARKVDWFVSNRATDSAYPYVNSGSVCYLAYELHNYEAQSDWATYDGMVAARSGGIPLIIGEFAPNEANSNQTQADTQALMNYCNTNKIPYAGWTFDFRTPPDMLQDLESQATGAYGAGTPLKWTSWGLYFINLLRAQKGLPAVNNNGVVA